MGKRIDPLLADAIETQLLKGMGVTAVAREVGCRHGTVQIIRDRLGMPKKTPAKCLPLSDTDAAYMAGIIDGEGCIWALHREQSRLHAGLAIGNTDRPLIDWLYSVTGNVGCVCSQPAHDRYRETHEWRVSIYTAASVLTQVRPFLRQKANQADYLIELAELKYAHRRQPYPARVFELVDALKKAKHV